MFQPVYRAFALRMAAAALIAGAVLGGITWFYETEAIDDKVVALALADADAFATRHHDELAAGRHDALEGGLRTFLANRGDDPDGHFLLAELYDGGRNPIAEAATDGADAAERAFDRRTHRFPGQGAEATYDKAQVGPQLYIRVVTALTGGTGYFEGVYLVSAARIALIRTEVLQSVGVVVAVVLLTTLFLLPAVVAFNRRLVQVSGGLLRANLETLELLGSAIAKRDSDTNAHNYRVTLYAVRLAEAMGVEGEAMRGLIKGAFLHDVGKIAIPDGILLKPGRLTADEFAQMKTHVLHGGDIIARSSWLSDAAPVVVHHHERIDGAGYPMGLKGDAIPLSARIFAIADVFDALTSRRPYKEPFPFAQAMAMLDEQRGRHFDPRALDAFTLIAERLYAAYGGREDAALETELLDAVRGYFQVG